MEDDGRGTGTVDGIAENRRGSGSGDNSHIGISGSQSDSGGSTGDSSTGSVGGASSEGDSRKIDLLERIRSKRREGHSPTATPENGDSSGNAEGIADPTIGDESGTEGHAGTPGNSAGRRGRTDKKAGASNSGTGETGKRQSVTVKPVAPTSTGLQVQWQNVLTDKEAKELLPKTQASLRTLFRYADEGITATTRDGMRASIWRTIDDEDLQILADAMVEAGRKSRIIATTVRKMVGMHRMLQIGLITGPRFVMTLQHYKRHGGFSFMGKVD